MVPINDFVSSKFMYTNVYIFCKDQHAIYILVFFN